MKLFGKRTSGAAGQADTSFGRLVESVKGVMNQARPTVELGRAALATESLRMDQIESLTSTVSTISVGLESIRATLGLEKSTMTQTQIDAGSAAAILASDVAGFLRHDVKPVTIATEGLVPVVTGFGADAMMDRAFGLEAYNENENRNAAVYSIVYNMQAARQDEFGETFFPTIVVTPDNAGFVVSVNLMTVYNELTRNISGAVTNFNKKNLVRAVADATVLRNEATKITPVNRPQSLDKFVDPALVPAKDVVVEGETIHTAPLATGKELDILALSQTDALLSMGTMDMTDSLDPTISLDTIYAKVGDDVVSFTVRDIPFANFVYSAQNNYRVEVLNFSTTSLLLNKNTKAADGSALVTLKPIVDNDLIVRLSVVMSGDANIEFGKLGVYGNRIEVHSVQDATGVALSLDSGTGKAIVDLFAGASIFGYDIIAYRANANKRQRGQLIDVTKVGQMYYVPLRGPITALRPTGADNQNEATDLQALITATRIRTSNAAVTHLLRTTDLLNEYIDARDVTGDGPELLGVGRFFVRPTFFKESIDMNSIVDSIKSSDRAADIQAALIVKIRDYAFRMYAASEYQAGANALAGGIAPVPTVIIGTDPIIGRYLFLEGDTRMLGDLPYRVVTTLDKRMAGRIAISFSVFDNDRNNVPNPMSFGNMAWSPELTTNVQVTRNGAVSYELAVQPRFQFITNLPVMTMLSVSNIPDMLNKVPMKFDQV